jgi:hypothetical protein
LYDAFQRREGILIKSARARFLLHRRSISARSLLCSISAPRHREAELMCEFSEQQLHSSISASDSSSSSAHLAGPLRSGPDQASIERRNDEMIDRGTPASEGDEGQKEAEGTREVVEAECERGRPRDDEIMAQHHAIRAEEAEKMSFVGIKVLSTYFFFPSLLLFLSLFSVCIRSFRCHFCFASVRALHFLGVSLEAIWLGFL